MSLTAQTLCSSREINAALLRALDHFNRGAWRRGHRGTLHRRLSFGVNPAHGWLRIWLLALQRAWFGQWLGSIAAKKFSLVDSSRLFIALINRVAHYELKLAFARRERELLCLFRSHQQGDGLDTVGFALVLRLVDVLTVRQHLNVLQDNLRNRILHAGLFSGVDNNHDVDERAGH